MARGDVSTLVKVHLSTVLFALLAVWVAISGPARIAPGFVLIAIGRAFTLTPGQLNARGRDAAQLLIKRLAFQAAGVAYLVATVVASAAGSPSEPRFWLIAAGVVILLAGLWAGLWKLATARAARVRKVDG